MLELSGHLEEDVAYKRWGQGGSLYVVSLL